MFKDKFTGIIYSTKNQFLINQYRENKERFEEIEIKKEVKEVKEENKKTIKKSDNKKSEE